MEEKEKQILGKYQTWKPLLVNDQKIYNGEQFQKEVYSYNNGCFGCKGCGVDGCQGGD